MDFGIIGSIFILGMIAFIFIDAWLDYYRNDKGCHGTWVYNHPNPKFVDGIIGHNGPDYKRLCSTCGIVEDVSYFVESDPFWYVEGRVSIEELPEAIKKFKEIHDSYVSKYNNKKREKEKMKKFRNTPGSYDLEKMILKVATKEDE